MTIKYINGCAIDYTLEGGGKRVLLHGCNAQGVMGSGIALQVKNRYEGAYAAYLNSGYHLGTISYNKDRTVYNMVTQFNYGSNRSHRYTNYGALARCLLTVSAYSMFEKVEFVVPYNMCCDRGGGDWEVVLEMIEGTLGNVHDITIVKYDK